MYLYSPFMANIILQHFWVTFKYERIDKNDFIRTIMENHERKEHFTI